MEAFPPVVERLDEIPMDEIPMDDVSEINTAGIITIGQGSFGTVSIYTPNPTIVIKEHIIENQEKVVEIYKKNIKALNTQLEIESDKNRKEELLEEIKEITNYLETLNNNDSCKELKAAEYDKQKYAFDCLNSFLYSINVKIPRPLLFKYATKEHIGKRQLSLDKTSDSTSCVSFMEKLNYPSQAVLHKIIKDSIVGLFHKSDPDKHSPPYLFFSDIGDEYEHGKVKLRQMKSVELINDLYAVITDPTVVELAKSMMNAFFALTFNCKLILQDVEFLLTDTLATRDRACIGLIDFDQVSSFENREKMGMHQYRSSVSKYDIGDDIAFIYMNLSGNSYGHPMQIDNKSVWKFLPDPNILPELFLNECLLMPTKTISARGRIRRIIPEEAIAVYSKIIKTILETQFNTMLLTLTNNDSLFSKVKTLFLTPNNTFNNVCIYGCLNEIEISSKFESTLTRLSIGFSRVEEINLNNLRYFLKTDIAIEMDPEYTYYLLTGIPINRLNLFDDYIETFLKREQVYNVFNTYESSLLLFDILIQKLYILKYFQRNATMITEDFIRELEQRPYNFKELIHIFDERRGGKTNTKTRKSSKQNKNKTKKHKKHNLKKNKTQNRKYKNKTKNAKHN